MSVLSATSPPTNRRLAQGCLTRKWPSQRSCHTSLPSGLWWKQHLIVMSSRLPNPSPSQALGYQQSSRQEGTLCVGGKCPKPSLMFNWSSDMLSHPVSVAVTGSSWWLHYVQEMNGDGLFQIENKLWFPRWKSHARDSYNYMLTQIPYGVCFLTFWEIRKRCSRNIMCRNQKWVRKIVTWIVSLASKPCQMFSQQVICIYCQCELSD